MSGGDVDPVDAEIAAMAAEHDQLCAAQTAGEDVDGWAADFERRRLDLDRRLADDLLELRLRRAGVDARLRAIRREMRAMFWRHRGLPVPPCGVWAFVADTPDDVSGLVDLWAAADIEGLA